MTESVDPIVDPRSAVMTFHTFASERNRTRFLSAGPSDGPLMLFLHGWPGIGLMWRAQLEAFSADGWHCVAPDMRGYGGSSAPDATDAYRIEEIVADMVELQDHLGGEPAVLVGHDWGSIVAGALASHEPDRVRGVVLVSWAYFPGSNALTNLVRLVDRNVYPYDEYPDGQWDYYRQYTTHFDEAVTDLNADVPASLASIFRAGDPQAVGSPSPSAAVSRNGGRFGSARRAPAVEPDRSIWSDEDFDALVCAFEAGGFHGPCAWYANDEANIVFARAARDGGRLSMPVLFVNGDWDLICSIEGNAQGDPMRQTCTSLTLTSLPAGHWLPQERSDELVGAIRAWLSASGLTRAE